MLRALLSVGLTFSFMVVGCRGGSSNAPPPPPNQNQGQNQNQSTPTAGCGLNMHPSQPQCEAKLDAQCCAQQQKCAQDPDCQQAVSCIVACDAEVAQKRKSGAPDACACFPKCFEQLNGAGAAAMQQLVGCTQTGFEGMSCGSQC